MHGLLIENGPMDWQVFQQEDGAASVRLSGTWNEPQAALDVGVGSARPIIRVVSEADNYQVIPWTEVKSQVVDQEGWKGVWETELRIPAGGPYRIEGGLDTHSANGQFRWIFRGDVRRHIGVGDLFVMAGQSNAAGYAKDMAFDPPQVGVHLFRNCSCWDIAAHPVNEATFAGDVANLEMGNPGVSPYVSFGKHFSRVSGRPVGLIATALGGQPISRWDRRTDGALFDRMMSQIRACGSRVAGILWYQGCSDTHGDQADEYLEKFRRLVEDTRQELGYQVPFFTFQINRAVDADQTNDGWARVRESQRQAARRIPGVYVLSTLNCGLSDSIHNNASANVLLGEKLAKQCAGVLCGAPEFNPPDLEDAALCGAEVTLAFSHVADELELSRVTAGRCGFTVEDEEGFVPIAAWRAEKNAIVLTLGRAPAGSCAVSYAWEPDPTSHPVVDLVTYLPVLGFYRVPVRQVK